jgi:Fe-S-cluster containining protein
MSGLYHRCTSCGGSCQGVRVRLVGPEEERRILVAADALEVQEAVEGGVLRQTETGECVFLDDENLCRIHGAFGADIKPLICRQYPLVALLTESGERLGLDPGCYSAFATRRSGAPAQVAEELVRRTVHFESPLSKMEDVLLAVLTRPDQSVERVIARLAGGHGESLPAGFSERLVGALNCSGIRHASAHPSAGPSVRVGLAPILAALPNWVAHGPPETPWDPEMTRWGLEVSRRMIWLRLAPQLPSPMVVTLLSLCGSLAAKWAHGQDESGYAVSLAAWSRAMRRPLFWGSLLPDPGSLQRLLRGP